MLYSPEVNRGLVSYKWYEVATPTFISQVAESINSPAMDQFITQEHMSIVKWLMCHVIVYTAQ